MGVIHAVCCRFQSMRTKQRCNTGFKWLKRPNEGVMGFGSVKIITVLPGTVVGKDDKGNEFKVTDESAVTNGGKLWVTPKIYAALKVKAKQG